MLRFATPSTDEEFHGGEDFGRASSTRRGKGEAQDEAVEIMRQAGIVGAGAAASRPTSSGRTRSRA